MEISSQAAEFVSQLLIGLLTVTSIIMIARKNRWGFVVAIVSLPFWIYSTYNNEVWGMFISSIAATFSWSYGVYEWFFDKKKSLCLSQLLFKAKLGEFGKFSKGTVTRTTDAILNELRKNNIPFDEATLDDFLNLFPSRQLFLKTRNIGDDSAKLMRRIIENDGRVWPEIK